MIPDIKELNFPKIDGKQYATLTHATPKLDDMGEKSISTQVRIDGEIVPDFSFDWAVKFQGEKYIMPLRIPAGAKENTSLDSTIDLTFQHWAVYQLKRWPFVTIQQIEAGTYLPDEEVATVQLNLGDFCELFGQVLEYYYGGAITIDLNPGWQYKKEATIITISHTKIWNVLTDAFYDKYGVRWEIKASEDAWQGENGGERYVIRVGYPTTEVDHIFEYGFEGGLLKVERQVQSEEIRNMLKGRGGDTNIPFRYFKDTDPNNPDFEADPDWVEELANIYFTNLMGATFRSYVQGWKAAHISKYPGYVAVGEGKAYAPWAYRKGYTDTKFAPVEFVADEIAVQSEGSENSELADSRPVEILPGYRPYVKKGSSLDKYGPLPDTLDNSDDIYPTLQGTGFDIAVDVEQTESDDVAGSTENDARIEDKTYPDIVRKNAAPGHGTAADGSKRTYFSVGAGKNANIEGYAGARAYNPRNHADKSDFIAELSCTVRVFDAGTGEERSASGIPAGDWYFTVEYSFNNTAGEALNVTFSFNGVKIVSATPSDKWRNTFDIWVKNIWGSTRLPGETDSQYAERVWKPRLGDREGNTGKVVFTSGALAHEDYEFTIVGFPVPDSTKTYEGEQSHWRITLVKSEAELDATGLYVPSTRKQGKAGDTFVFIGTEMTHVPYVVDAEVRLDDGKKDRLGEVKEIKPTFVVTTDRIRLNQKNIYDAERLAYIIREAGGKIAGEKNGGIALESSGYHSLLDILRPGCVVRLADKRFIQPIDNRAYETLYLQSITYTYREPTSDDAALNPDVEIVLGTEYGGGANPVSMMQGEISALQRQVGSISNIEQIVRAVGDRQYLRKDGISERSLSPTQFFSLLTSGDFRAGLVGGAGWGFYKDENGRWVLEADRVNVRQEMQVNTLVINQAEGRGGMEIDTAAYIEGVTRVEETEGGYVCYFDQKGGSVANLFHVDDVAYCSRWTAENEGLKFYRRRVTAVGADSITLSKTDVNGAGVPAEGDNIIHYGNYTDKTRQYVKVRDVVGGGYERFRDGLDSVNAEGTEYYFVGRQSGMYNGRPRFYIGDSKGYVEWVNGELNIKGRISVQSSIGDKSIGTYVTEAAQRAADGVREELQGQIDGVVEAFNGEGAPTLTNYPAGEWTTDGERKRHNKDVYKDITPYVDDVTTPTSGQSWRWYYNSATDYGWVKIADSDAVRALQLAQASVRDTDVLYISHTSQTSAPALPAVNANGVITDARGWQTAAPAWSATRYIWQTTYVRRGDGTAAFSDPTCISGRNGEDGRGIVSVVEMYAVNNDAATAPADGDFSTTVPQTSETNRYLWNMEVTTYTDKTQEATDKVVVGVHGANGEDGASVTAVTNYYLASAQATGVTVSTPGWTTDASATAATMTDKKPYLWNYERVTFSKGDATETVPHVVGRMGRGVAKIEEEYYLSDSQTQLTGGEWKSEANKPTWTAGKYMWTRTKVTYTDDMVEYMAAVCVTGTPGTSVLAEYSADAVSWHPTFTAGDVWMRTSADGGMTWSAGARIVGMDGAPGADGADGPWRKFQWAKNESAVTAPVSGWKDAPETAMAGEYVWMRSGMVVPPATEPAAWERAVRLTGDRGEAGESVYVLDIDNEVSGVVCDAAGTVTGPYPTARARVWRGSEEVTGGVVYSIAQKTGMDEAAIDGAGEISMGGMTADTAMVTVQANAGGVTLTSVVSVYKVRPGADGAPAVVYSIEPSAGSVTRSMSGVLSVSTVSCTVYRTTGAALRVATDEHTLSYRRLPDGATGVLSRTAGVSGGVDVLKDTEAIVFELRSGDVLLDRERVPVLADASDIVLGGANLLRNTDYIDGLRHWEKNFPASGSVSVVPRDTAPGWLDGRASLHVRYLSGGDRWRSVFQRIHAGGVRAGSDYVLSGWVYVPSQAAMSKTVYAKVGRTLTDGSVYRDEVIDLRGVESGKWCYVSAVWHAPEAMDEGVSAEVMFQLEEYGEFYLNGWKFERGNVGTAWSGSPEDVSYLRSALRESTTIEGGLIAATLLKLGFTAEDGEYRVTAGMNGAGTSGNDVAFWSGGGCVDADAEPDNDDAATFLIRHSGEAYACGNTVRFRTNRIEVGTPGSSRCVVLDDDGLKLTDGNEERLRVVHQSVGSLADAASSQTITGPSVKSYGISLRKVVPGSSGEGVTGVASYQISAGAETAAFAIGNAGTVLGAGAAVKLTVSAGFYFDTREEGDPGVYDVVPLRGRLRVRVYSSGGTVLCNRSVTLRSTDGMNHTGTLTLNETVKTAGVYYGKVYVESDTTGSGSAAGTATVSVTAGGSVQLGYADQTILGNDGLMSKWGNAALLVRNGEVHMKVGSTELVVAEDGVKAVAGGRTVWLAQ